MTNSAVYRLFSSLLLVAVGLVIGLLLAKTDSGQNTSAGFKNFASQAASRALEAAMDVAGMDTRALILMENPSVMAVIMKSGAFGGESSISAAQNMFGRHVQEAIEDIRSKTKVIEVAPRSWLIRLPIVNTVLFETDEGLVLVDTGMAPAGPAIVDAIKSISDKPLHTIILTHGHVDHAYGTWAMLEAGWTPQIIAHEAIIQRFERYLRIPGSLANYMSQPKEQLPTKREDLVWPTRTFTDRLELTIGGEKFVLQHHRGETDDQFYVWAANREVLASADYYQGFLPNAGNGKRYQRHLEDWAVAIREMAALNPKALLPAHGEAMTDTVEIVRSFTVLADVLDYVVDTTLSALNQGVRKDLIISEFIWPERFANEPTLQIQYVNPQDLVKMVIKKYTGWWDDIPSHWTPAPLASEAAAIAHLAGGVEQVAAFAEQMIDTDIRLASHFADWAFYADPDNESVQDAVIKVYRQRIIDPASNTMEMLTYLDQMVRARDRRRSLE